jgi:hypothetical protein
MRTLHAFFGVIITGYVLLSCKKEDATPIEPTPIVSNDSSLIQVTSIDKADINEFDIAFQGTPAGAEDITALTLYWSLAADFSSADSILVAAHTTTGLQKTQRLGRLKQDTTYYVKLGCNSKHGVLNSTEAEESSKAG